MWRPFVSLPPSSLQKVRDSHDRCSRPVTDPFCRIGRGDIWLLLSVDSQIIHTKQKKSTFSRIPGTLLHPLEIHSCATKSVKNRNGAFSLSLAHSRLGSGEWKLAGVKCCWPRVAALWGPSPCYVCVNMYACVWSFHIMPHFRCCQIFLRAVEHLGFWTN